LDSKVRIWNIPDKKVALWNEVPGPNNLITTANFCQNGKFAVVGTYDGRVIFYHTEQLKYHTQIILNKKKCVKISGIESMPGEDKILVTSNDSRIRLFDLRDLSLNCKYTGSVTRSSQIKASFSHDGKFIISGSENNFIYLWRTAHEYVGFRGGARRDRNKYWEGVRVHNAVVTCAIFAPDPDLIIKEMIASDSSSSNTATAPGATGTGPRTGNPADASSRNSNTQLGYVIASADFNGQIKICVCRVKPKCSSLPVSAIA
jgi:WD40 repeat protein